MLGRMKLKSGRIRSDPLGSARIRKQPRSSADCAPLCAEAFGTSSAAHAYARKHSGQALQREQCCPALASQIGLGRASTGAQDPLPKLCSARLCAEAYGTSSARKQCCPAQASQIGLRHASAGTAPAAQHRLVK